MSTEEVVTSRTYGRCEGINQNGFRCSKNGVAILDDKPYCKRHLEDERRRREAERHLPLPFPGRRSEDQISEGKPWVAVVLEKDYREDWGLYAVSIAVEGGGIRKTGMLTLTSTPRPPWLWGPTLDAARRIAARFNEDRGYSPEAVKHILGGLGADTSGIESRSAGSNPNDPKFDLHALEEDEDVFVSFHGNNNRVYWTSANIARYTGHPLRHDKRASNVHVDDLHTIYQWYAQSVVSSDPYVTDFRWKRWDGKYFSVRYIDQAIFDPHTKSFLMRCAVGHLIDPSEVAYRAPTPNVQLVHAHPMQKRARKIIEQRLMEDYYTLLADRTSVAFVPRNEKLAGLGYRLAMARPGRMGYVLIGHYPYLPTIGYYPPVFVGRDWEAAQVAAERINAKRSIDRDMAMNVLHATKCMQYL